MNIHEHQAKQILKQFGAVVPEGVFSFTVEELLEKCKSLKTDKYVLKAQIHAGVPVIVGKNGVEKIEEINLDEKEKSEFLHSVEAVKKLWGAASNIDTDLAK